MVKPVSDMVLKVARKLCAKRYPKEKGHAGT
jgi:hypothetical protein